MAEMNKTIKEALEEIKSIADTKTVIGEPMNLVDGVTIIPVSKVTVGTALGGGEYAAKKSKKKDNAGTTVSDNFTGGSGAGISVIPVAFLVITASGETKLLNVGENSGYLEASILGAVNGFDAALDKLPGVVDKVKGLFKNKKTKAADAPAVTEEAAAEEEA